MARELPFFKFQPSAWENGRIQLCSRQSKGLFTDLCSAYWTRQGELPYAFALHKHCNGDASLMQELINNEVIIIEDDQIIIEFLDEQLSEFIEIGKKRADAANKRWNASAMQVQSNCNARREEKRREEINISFDVFWDAYGKKVGNKKLCIQRWNKLTNEDRQKIIDTLPSFIASVTDKKYLPYPEKYLNAQRWNDEVVAPATPVSSTQQFYPQSKGDPQPFINRNWKPQP